MNAKRLACAALLILGAATVANSQQLQPGAQALSPMHLDVSVLDAAGRPVHDLAVSDFEVRVDGRVLPVVSVTQVHGRSPLGAAVGTQTVRGRLLPAQVAHDVLRNDDAVDRYVAVVLDDIARTGSDTGPDSWMSTAGLDLARAVVDRIGPDDRGTVFFTFMGRQQGLTSDRDRLRASLGGFTRRQVQPADCQASGSVEGCVIDTLQRVADALPGVPAQRKVVLFISGSTGLPAVSLPPVGQRPTTAAQRALQSLLAVNAVVYSITPEGVVGPVAADTVSLADATGGRGLVDSAQETPVEAIFGELDAHYLLTLGAPQHDGAYRDVSVHVSRAGTTVRTRRGDFAPDGMASTQSAGAGTPLEAALLAPHQATGVPMGVSVAVFGVPGRREAVVSIAAAITSATASDATAWQADIASTAFDPQWRPRASHRQTIEVTTQLGAGPQTVDVLSAVELLPGRYEIRVGGESAGRAGSVFVDVDVPEFQTTPLTASGAVVSTVPTPYAANPLLAQTLPVTPTTRRLFLRQEMVDVLVRFYQGGRNRLRNLPVSLRIADAAGEGIIQGTETIPPSQFTEARSTDWRFTLPLDRLLPGDYLLTVEAELDDRLVTRHVRFAVMQ